jgi:two-component system, OmpR family, phosphate regulon response regulator PhoB
MALVLVADDDPVTCELIVYKLRAEGYETIVAEDGTTALAQARERGPDIAVLDVHMPGMSGFDVCRMLRSDPDLARIPVIMLTASVQETDVSTGFDSGADDYVVKPFSPRELVSRIQAVLARAGA